MGGKAKSVLYTFEKYIKASKIPEYVTAGNIASLKKKKKPA